MAGNGRRLYGLDAAIVQPSQGTAVDQWNGQREVCIPFRMTGFPPGKMLAITADGTIAQESVPMNKEAVLTKLRELKPTITARYKVREIGLFGSFVRGEQGSSSDIDLLAEFEANADLFDLIGLELYLEEIFQRPVDVVPKPALRAELRETVLDQVVTV